VIGFALGVALFAVAGAALALRAAGPSERRISIGSVQAQVVPARRGEVDLYVPLVDWGIRFHRHRAPLGVRLELRALDRRAALDALDHGATPEERLRALDDELNAAAADALRRGALAALVGGIAGGVLAGALGGALLRRRAPLAAGALGGLASAVIAVPLAALSLAGAGTSDVRGAVYYARGDELPRLLALPEAGERYRRSYDEALAGLENLLVAASAPPGAPVAHSVVVAADLHSNRFVLDALGRYASGKLVFLAGDMSQIGSTFEATIAPDLARLGKTVVAVSGNHDSPAFMRALAAEGVLVLTRRGQLRPDGTVHGGPVLEIDGLAVAGFDDPLEGAAGGARLRQLELAEGERRHAEQAITAWFAALPRRPDVVLVHQHALAHVLLASLAPGDPPVTVLTGHDHDQHVDRVGPHVLVDPGSVGAGGPFEVGKEPAALAQLYLAVDAAPVAVDLIASEPLSGQATARRLVLAPARLPVIEAAPARD
jgi:predicted phosphodiesterase